MKALVVGWFSFEGMGATAGDIQARDVVCAWLASAGWSYDIATAAPFEGGVDWRTAEPARYAMALFVCGPFGNGPPITDFLPRFKGLRLVGVDLSMLESLETWNPFDLLLERDSSRTSRPDLAFAAPSAPTPVAGLVLIHPQPEYRDRDRHQVANAALRRLVACRDLAAVPIDTRLDENLGGLKSAGEIETLIARSDVVLTTRLHGLVLALKNAVPVLAIDPVSGGHKVRRQADTVEWPVVFDADALDDAALGRALDYCLSEEARRRADLCRALAREKIEETRRVFMNALGD